MIPFDAFTLAAVVHEMRRVLVDARVQRIYQPAPADIVLSLFGASGAQKLLISADPRLCRVHLSQVRRENPKTPPNFCLVCRKDLEGACLTGIDMPRFDRVLRLTFRAPEGGSLFLFAELMGRNCNLILVSGTGMIRGVIRPVQSAERSLRVGETYHEPPGYHDKRDLLTVADDEARPDGELPTHFAGVGKFVQEELRARASGGDEWPALLELASRTRRGDFDPHTIGSADGVTQGVWAFEPMSVPRGLRFARESVSVALDTFYATLRHDEAEAGEKAALEKAIGKEIAYRKKEAESARRTIAESERAEEYEQWGNLLLANLHAIEKGSESAVVVNYYDADGGTAVIPLDVKKTPHENAERQFERARKARDAREYADGRLADLVDELETLSDLKRDLAKAETPEDFAAIRVELTDMAGEERVGGGKRTEKRVRDVKDKPFGGHRVGTYNLDGWTLFVGETAQANDHLLTRASAPSDIWFHVRSGTGAHGILRTNKQPDKVPDKVMRRAAEIVAFRSGSVKHSSVVAVDITERRYVRKPKGVKAGLAIYTQAKTLDVNPRLS